MRNLKVTRRLRGITPASQRRDVRKLREEVDKLQVVVSDIRFDNKVLAAELRRERRRTTKIELPKDYTDRIAEKFCAVFGRAIADKAMREHPEFERWAGRVGHELAKVFRDDLSFHMGTFEPEFWVQEIVSTKHPFFKFQMDLGNAVMNFGVDRREIELRRAMWERELFDDKVKVPPRMRLEPNDLNEVVQ